MPSTMKPRVDTADSNDCGCVSECDFIKDPDQMSDFLPQPFRMLNKVTQRIIEDAWMLISMREDERLDEAMRFKPPQYECTVHLQVHGSALCLCASEDGNYLFVGLSDGIAVINTSLQSSCDHWKDDTMSIVSLSVVNLDEETHLITTLDNVGAVRLFAFCKDMFFLLSTFYDMVPDVEQKFCAKKCESSTFADFMAIALEDVNSHESSLEVYKLPHDTWIKELEPFMTVTRKDTLQNSRLSLDATESTTAIEVGTGPIENTDEVTDSKSLHSRPTQEERTVTKFTSPLLQFRAKPPPSKTTGINWTTPYSACKAIDASCEVVGSMFNHLLSSQLLQTRQRLFAHLHPQIEGEQPEEDVPGVIEPTFHFVTAGRCYPSLFDTTPTTGESSVLVVWWTNQHLLQHYSLRRSAKDPKDSKESKEQKCDVAWPLSDKIVTSAVSPCTTYIAVALRNSAIIVWDKLQGVANHISRLQTGGTVRHLRFLSVDDDNSMTLLATCSDGQMYSVDVRNTDDGGPTKVADVASTIEATPASVDAVMNIPELIVTCHKDGRLFVEDVLKKTPICELTLPATHKVQSPLRPTICTTANGQIVYVKGETENESAIFAFALRSFPSLDEYFNRKQPPTMVKLPRTVQELADAYFTQRVSEQASRVKSLQDRWQELKLRCEPDATSRVLTSSA